MAMYLPPAEAAKLMGLTEKQVRALAKEGRIFHTRVSGRIYLRADKLDIGEPGEFPVQQKGARKGGLYGIAKINKERKATAAPKGSTAPNKTASTRSRASAHNLPDPE